mgnify:CR=1 FL=1
MQSVERTFAGRKLSIETGRMAKQAAGSALVQYGDTMVLATAVGRYYEAHKQLRPKTLAQYKAASDKLLAWGLTNMGADVTDFFVERVRMDFDRDVPFQMGGDIMGMRRSLEFDLAEESVQLVDWRQLQRLAP